MKKIILIASILTASAFATDFSQMTMEQLNAMRGSVPAAERDAFKSEMQIRAKAMNQTDKEKYSSQRRENNSKGQGSMQRLRDGSGGGMMRQGGGKR